MGKKGWGKFKKNFEKQAEKIVGGIEKELSNPKLANAVKAAGENPADLAPFQLVKRIEGMMAFGGVDQKFVLELAKRIASEVETKIIAKVRAEENAERGDILLAIISEGAAERSQEITSQLQSRVDERKTLYEEAYSNSLAADIVDNVRASLQVVAQEMPAEPEFNVPADILEDKGDAYPVPEEVAAQEMPAEPEFNVPFDILEDKGEIEPPVYEEELVIKNQLSQETAIIDAFPDMLNGKTYSKLAKGLANGAISEISVALKYPEIDLDKLQFVFEVRLQKGKISGDDYLLTIANIADAISITSAEAKIITELPDIISDNLYMSLALSLGAKTIEPKALVINSTELSLEKLEKAFEALTQLNKISGEEYPAIIGSIAEYVEMQAYSSSDEDSSVELFAEGSMQPGEEL